MNMKRFVPGLFLLSSLALLIGCNSGQQTAGGTPSAEGKKFLLPTEPASAKNVKDARQQAGDNEEIVLVGRIGGEEKPFVDGVAAFTIVDTSLVPCSERPGETCPTPWDYCCDLNALPESTATVKFVDAAGNPLPVGAKELLGVKELQTVVVRGQAKRNGTNLVVLATGLYVKK
jgi:hypothetical protein